MGPAFAANLLASEFVGTSVTSQAWSQDRLNTFLQDNPHVQLLDGRYRGYVRAELVPGALQVELRALDSVREPGAECRTLARFVVEDGRPGPQRR